MGFENGSTRRSGPGSSLLRALGLIETGVPRSVLTLQAGALLNALGNGLVLPFIFIYLHNVRGFSLGTAGLVVGTGSAVGLVATPLAGSIVDRVGGRRCLYAALALLATGFAGYALVREPWQAFATAVVVGVGNGFFWPSQSSLIAGLTPADRRPAAFAMQRVVMNLGIGLGALIGGFVATTSEPWTFQALFLADASTFAFYVVALRRVPDPPPAPPAEDGESPGRYADVLRNRAFMGLIGLNLVLVTAGIAQIEVFPAYAKNHAGVSETGIGWIFLVNTLLIVVMQMPLARLAQGRRRMPSLAIVALIWAGSWLLVPVIAAGWSGLGATVLFAAMFAVFGVGECFHGAVQAPLVSDLADHRMIGRYMAISALSWNAAFAVGPAVAGFVLGRSPTALWVGAAAVLALAGVAALLLERALPRHVRITPRPAPEAALTRS